MSAASFALVLSLPVLFAPLLFHPHHLMEGKRKRTRTRREGWQTVGGAALLLMVNRWRGVARCGDDITQKRTVWPSFPFFLR